MTDSNEKPCHSSIKTPPPEPCTHPNPCPYSGEGADGHHHHSKNNCKKFAKSGFFHNALVKQMLGVGSAAFLGAIGGFFVYDHLFCTESHEKECDKK